MWFHLKFAALLSVAWVLLLAVRPLPGAAELIAIVSPAGALALGAVHACLAVFYWWGSLDPPHRLWASYVGIATFLLRSVLGIYLVLYVMAGPAAMVMLVEMVLSLGLLSAMINGLPAALYPDRHGPHEVDEVIR